ncbi:TraB/GumN family protein [Paraflavitalea pollutisoli]|uniref:TraB/GumN family protein n=1 Tax=Paraflavitalea pollutisoli TaxID=3034143 RepID=UPI0023EADD87|nr:TraB/GumN family protein [Paraflavitalea sp. H1-2-19X]
MLSAIFSIFPTNRRTGYHATFYLPGASVNPSISMKATIVLSVFLCMASVSSQARQTSPPSKGKRTTAAKTAVTATLPPFKEAPRKYPSLLWEITGKGMTKPSYLFGTMHVSDKMAFHLGDAFYNAIRNADVVALETNPETWQEDYSKSPFLGNRGGGRDKYNARERWNSFASPMWISTFAVDNYDETVKAALSVEPSMINGMLYRTYGSETEDFEEDTFLDMYIFQVGKKLGKRLSGVENFEESEKLVMEAYMDMARDEKRKRKSYDRESNMTNPRKLEEAYRRGDLDLLDSLQGLSVTSDAFQEKFLYKRNEIQANSIDSIIRKQSLFVGVGAAHLPGKRGVIEMLRDMGYTLRPVFMDDRNSLQKDSIEKTRLVHAMVNQQPDDGAYQVSIPGKQFYRFTEWSGMDVLQYADLVNGAYYMVTRIKTNSLALGHSAEQTLSRLDSLLYEHIPGKLVRKTAISKNGYKGYDIVNRTRRGDYQRYNIYITPFEMIVFKISGNGEYVTQGTEADRYFQSIRLKEYPATNWQAWQPATGGFSVQLPQVPVLLRDNNIGTNRLEYSTWDAQDGNSYLIMKVNLHNHGFLGKDSFELSMMEESYAFSVHIDKEIKRKFTSAGKYPALEVQYRHKDGSFSTVRYLIRGAQYYVVIARYKKENANVRRFIESFTIQPYVYPAAQSYDDSTMYYRVKASVAPYAGKKPATVDMDDLYEMALADKDSYEYRDAHKEKMSVVGNDSIGEKVMVFYERFSTHAYWRDTAAFKKAYFNHPWDEDSAFVIRYQQSEIVPGGILQGETHYTDTSSSRLLLVKTVLKDNHLFQLVAITDTVSGPGPFLRDFYASFRPVDTLAGNSLFTRKTARLVQELLGKDSIVARKASLALQAKLFDSVDVPLIRQAIDSITWNVPNYMATKKSLLQDLGRFPDTAVTTYLASLYGKVQDTTEFQQVILKALTRQKTRRSLAAFKDLMLEEPPIEDDEESYDDIYTNRRSWKGGSSVTVTTRRAYRPEGSWYGLEDSLALTQTIFPDLLQLVHIDDYETSVLGLLTTLVDSGLVKAADYEPYFSKLYLDGKRMLKKQLAGESRAQMEKAARKDQVPAGRYRVQDEDEEDNLDEGNEDLEQYATLLFPFREKNAGVQTFFNQLMQTTDRRLLYNTFIFLLRKKQPVPDSLFLKYAALDQYRSELYGDLEVLGLTAQFPAKYKNQQDMTRSLLINRSERLEKADTLVYLDKLPVTEEGKKGWVHFYKYKLMRDDVHWQLAAVGMQPQHAGEVNVDNDTFTTSEARKLNPDEPIKKQLEQILKEMVNSREPIAEEFYEARNYRLSKAYLAEAVKRRRFRD